jgi:hypothetical protein
VIFVRSRFVDPRYYVQEQQGDNLFLLPPSSIPAGKSMSSCVYGLLASISSIITRSECHSSVFYCRCYSIFLCASAEFVCISLQKVFTSARITEVGGVSNIEHKVVSTIILKVLLPTLRIEIREVCTLEASKGNNIFRKVRFEEQIEHCRRILPSSQEIRSQPEIGIKESNADRYPNSNVEYNTIASCSSKIADVQYVLYVWY